jgi:hypothetical protein
MHLIFKLHHYRFCSDGRTQDEANRQSPEPPLDQAVEALNHLGEFSSGERSDAALVDFGFHRSKRATSSLANS